VVVTNTKGEQLTCSQVVVSVSIAVLKLASIQFSPPLPAPKLKAIKAIACDNALKVVLSFSHRFWPSDLHGIICVNTLIPEVWFDQPERTGPLTEESHEEKKPFFGTHSYTISGYATSAFADKIASLPKEKVFAEMLAMLDKMFGFNRAYKLSHSAEGRPETNIAKPATTFVVKSLIHVWADEPYIRGGYTSPTLGTNLQTRIDLAAPIQNKVFFCGEATNPKSYMTMHGAMETGKYAADALVEVAKATKTKL